jgi:chromosome segregation ATPase
LSPEGGSGPETFKWDLSHLSLTAGEQVVYRLEISDNDTVSGPKTAYSKTFTLSVRDERAKAAKEGEEAQEISDRLELLADHLEEKKDRKDLAVEMDGIMKRLESALEKAERAERFDLEGLKKNLSSLKERVPHEEKETMTREMERLALLSEEIAKRARMKELEAMAREMRTRQNRLIDSLSELKDRPNPETLEAVRKELKKVEELLRSVMEALSKRSHQRREGSF